MQGAIPAYACLKTARKRNNSREAAIQRYWFGTRN